MPIDEACICRTYPDRDERMGRERVPRDHQPYEDPIVKAIADYEATAAVDKMSPGLTVGEQAESFPEMEAAGDIATVSGWLQEALGKLFRMLNSIGFDGAVSVEWEDSGMKREVGPPESLSYVQRYNVRPPSAAFDAALAGESG